MTTTSATFHEGELAVQELAGVRDKSERVGRVFQPEMREQFQEFLRQQRLVIIAGSDGSGDTWASPLSGQSGFLRPLDPRTLYIAAHPAGGDPLAGALAAGGPLPAGMLAIDLASRGRVRLNGYLEPAAGEGMLLHTRQVYGNCQQYIQQRLIVDRPSVSARRGGNAVIGTTLTTSQRDWIACADTFFIASSHPRAGADASHRGGVPGFVQVLDATTLVFPDYSGNKMFNTLGNLAVNPRAGLLFIDFEGGATLQLSGDARIIWEPDRAAEFPGAERVVEFDVRRVIETPAAMPVRWEFVEYSRFNPSR